MSNMNIPIKISFEAADNGINEVFGSINLNIRNFKENLNGGKTSTKGVDDALKGLGNTINGSNNGIKNLNENLNKTTSVSAKAKTELKGISDTVKQISMDSAMIKLGVFSSVMGGIGSRMKYSAADTIDDLSNIQDNSIRIKQLIRNEDKKSFLHVFNDQLDELSTKTRASKSELSDLWYLISSSGVNKLTDITQLAQSSSLLSDASKRNLDSSQAFTILNAFKNSYQIPMAQMGLTTDIIARGKDLGSFNYHELEDTIKYATPILGAITNGDVATNMALLATLGNHDIKGSTAGTSIRSVAMAFIPAPTKGMLSDKEQKKFEDTLGLEFMNKGRNSLLGQIGITPEKIYVERDVKDKDGKVIGKEKVIDLEKALTLVAKHLKELKGDDRLSFIKGIYNKTALSAGITFDKFLGDFEENLTKLRDKDTQGFALSQALASRNTLGAKQAELHNAWQTAKISVLNDVVSSFLGNLFDSLKNKLTNIPKASSFFKNTVGVIGLISYSFISFIASASQFFVGIYFAAKATGPIIKALKWVGEALIILFRFFGLIAKIIGVVATLIGGELLVAIGGIALAFLAIYEVCKHWKDICNLFLPLDKTKFKKEDIKKKEAELQDSDPRFMMFNWLTKRNAEPKPVDKKIENKKDLSYQKIQHEFHFIGLPPGVSVLHTTRELSTSRGGMGHVQEAIV